MENEFEENSDESEDEGTEESNEKIEDIIEETSVPNYPRSRKVPDVNPFLDVTDDSQPVANLDTDLQSTPSQTADAENAPQYSAADYTQSQNYDEIYPRQVNPEPISPSLPETFSSGGFRPTNELASTSPITTNQLASSEYPEINERNYQSNLEQESKSRRDRRRA